MKEQYLMALDQGTTSSRCIIFNRFGKIISKAQKEYSQIFPKPGWVEHNPLEIWSSQYSVAVEALASSGLTASDISVMGIANQRETTVVWDKHTGKPVCNAIVWQCRRTSEYCDSLKAKGLEETIREKTGLVIDAYFSATKLKWILDNVHGAREEANKGNLLFGTVDTWLVWNLTKGKCHVTDYSNASRTMLFNINSLSWDEDILKEMDIPKKMLPEVLPSSHIYGVSSHECFGEEIKIGSIAGDQQAALFGQTCFKSGMVKNTYGTGCFMLMNTGTKPVPSKNGLLTTIAWGIGETVTYCLEGSVFIAGAAIQWLRDGLRMLEKSSDSESYALRVPDCNGLYFVPAFAGLGAPYWDQYARGIIVGITRSVEKEHFVRAALESLAYQSHDVIKAMEADSGLDLTEIKVDGGAASNNFLMQFQADILNANVKRPEIIESTALGAVYLAGLACGIYKDEQEIIDITKVNRVFTPEMDEEKRKKLVFGWNEAVKRSFGWENEKLPT